MSDLISLLMIQLSNSKPAELFCVSELALSERD